jgi:hypothetical protein
MYSISFDLGDFAVVFLWVVNWDRYNRKRKDVDRPSCFSLTHDFLNDEKICELNHAEIVFFIYLLGQCRKANSGIIAVPLAHCRQTVKIEEKGIEQCSKRLSALGLVKPVSEKEYLKHHPYTSRTRNRHVTDAVDDQAGTPFPSHSPILNSATGSIGSLNISHSSKKSSDEKFSLEHQEGRVVIPEFKSIEKILVAREVTLKTQQAWLHAFPDPAWVIGEVKKMVAWEATNIKKKRFGRFATNWLNRGWDKRPSKGNAAGRGKRDYSFLEGK